MITAAVYLPIKAPPSLFGASLLVILVLISLICARRVQELHVRLRMRQIVLTT
ncbi:hypothetical protein [Pseudomonas putida]